MEYDGPLKECSKFPAGIRILEREYSSFRIKNKKKRSDAPTSQCTMFSSQPRANCTGKTSKASEVLVLVLERKKDPEPLTLQELEGRKNQIEVGILLLPASVRWHNTNATVPHRLESDVNVKRQKSIISTNS